MNCKVKALMIINDEVQYELFKNYFKETKEVIADIKKFDGEKAYQYIMENSGNYDVVLLDVALPIRDGISVINDLYRNEVKNKYILISEYQTTCLKKITNIIPTIEAVFINPKYLGDIEKVIVSSVSKEKTIETQDEIEIKTIISKQLHKLGMPAHIKGYQYIREGIFQMFTNGTKVNKITKDLYPLIAGMYDTTPSRVERAIRHSIEVSWSRGDYEVMESIFGNSVDFERSKPTNSEFISSVADAILLENKLKCSKQVNYN